jgi:capsular exopolysaccharide synthesis family protein
MLHDQPPAPGDRNAPDYGSTASATAESLQVREYLWILKRYRWLIAGLLVLSTAATVVYNLYAPKVYQASATLQLQADPNVLGLDRPFMAERDRMSEVVPTELAVLESREFARLTRKELELAAAGNQSHATAAQQPDPRTAAPTLPLPTVDDIVAGRQISSVSGTHLISVGFRSTDPVRAAQVANAMAEAYVGRNLAVTSSTTGEASAWLQKQADEWRKRVEESEAALQEYRTRHQADALGDRLNDRPDIVAGKLADLQMALTEARTETIGKETQYQQLVALRSNPAALDTLPAIAANGFIQQLKRELADRQRQLAQASKELGERHPDRVKMQIEVDAAERRVQTEIATLAASIRNDYESARARETALNEAFERQKREVQALNAKAVEYTALDSAAKANRALLDDLLQRARQVTLSRDLPSGNVRVVDAAVVPRYPILPRKTRNILLALFGSGALSLALVFLLEALNTRIRTPDDVTRHLKIPILGMAPRVKRAKKDVSTLVSAQAPPLYIELLRGVRTHILATRSRTNGRTLLVTSAEPAAGKTITAANIALSLARIRQRVLLIDADLRRRQVHELFGVGDAPGLSNVLADLTPLSTAVHGTTIPHLSVMPAGSMSTQPGDLLSLDGLTKLIDEVEQQFDWVILDSPPVLAVTDACLMARVARGVVFVIRADRTSRDDAIAALERLHGVGAHVIGAVLNGVVLRRDRSYLPYYHLEEQADSSSNRPRRLAG